MTPIHSIATRQFLSAPDKSTCSFLDIFVHRLTKRQLNQAVIEVVTSGRRAVIANHNLHSLYLFHRDKWFREFYDLPELVHADGMGIVLLSALGKQRLKAEHRTTYIDWMPDLVAMAAQQGWRLFYVGSRPGIGDRGVAILRQSWPQLQIETAHGYFDATRDSVENQNLIRRIQKYEPHILLVGMGMPRQERWIAENLAELPCNVILPAGAAIDYIAGVVSTPPRWMGRLGLEWLYRLVSEPRRLAFRYLIEPWYIARLVVFHILSESWLFRFVRRASTNGD